MELVPNYIRRGMGPKPVGVEHLEVVVTRVRFHFHGARGPDAC
jgi:hypothetical protein